MGDEPNEIIHPNGASFVHNTVYDVFANDKQEKQQQQQPEHKQQPLVYKKVNKTNIAKPYVDRMVILRGNKKDGKGIVAIKYSNFIYKSL